MAFNSHRHKEQDYLPIASLSNTRREILTRAVANVLSTDLAKQTYAQIVDGYPLADVARDTYEGCLCSYEHPLYTDHKELCPGVQEETQVLCSELDVGTFLMPEYALRSYESASEGSPAFTTSLVELVARSLHHIGAWLYRQDRNRHKEDALGRWRPSEHHAWGSPKTFPYTLFCHAWYRDYDQYPGGIADSVGYWAEGRILGGVTLFDRRDPGKEKKADPTAIYTIADRNRTIYRICRLIDSQVEALAHFLLSETTPSPEQCPLPILPSHKSQERFDPESSILRTGIYRDRWERRLRPLGERDLRSRGGITGHFNYLSRLDMRRGQHRSMDERHEREFSHRSTDMILQLNELGGRL
ncbi:hypothetical protein B0J18DRAFT_440694 [Chaetomium sp. MPI-SDFR-AT-0129]|nr:hypothetical protein B0J18DRAFT_440694 [Chaetomium sp. MPI-SDFR-AT-0129]